MGSIAHCLKKFGLDKHTEKLLRDKVVNLKADGYTHSEASIQAAKDYADELSAQRADVLAQMSEQPASESLDVPDHSWQAGHEPEPPGVTFKQSIEAHDFGALTPEQERALKNTGGIVPNKTIGQRYTAMRANIGLKIEQGVIDQFAPLKKLDWNAYLLSRLSKGSDGAMEAMLTYGNLSLVDGVTNSDARGIGLIEQLRALEGEHHRFMWWVAAHRAEQLTTEQRERLFTAQDIADLKTLNQGDMKSGAPRAEAYMLALSQYNASSRNVLDIAEQSGIIDPESRKMWEKEFYVPFYRALEDEISTPNIGKNGGLVRQYAFKKLKGGTEKLNQDLLANVLMNWSHLLSASAKNRAARAALIAAEAAGVATEQPGFSVSGMPIPKNAVWYLENGQKSYYTVEDPLVMDAITSLEAGIVGGAAGRFLSTVKNGLTIGVTANPAFKIRNLARDSIQSVAMSGDLSSNVFGNVYGGIKEMADKKSQIRASLLAGGGIIRFGSMLEGNRSSHVSKLINAGIRDSTILDTKEKLLDMVQVAWDHYNELGDISEGANRASLYKQMIAAGKSHAEASLAARDLMDFSKGGSWGAIRFLVQTVPFANARAQGIYRFGQGMTQHTARFATVLTATALASVALMLAYDGDDDWKQREDWDRDNYWWFKVGEVAYRIPKPFEVGVLATVAERAVEAFTNDEMTAARFRDRLQFAVMNTFAMNPAPQLFKPMIDIYSNIDSFTGRPIESKGAENLPKSERYGPRTSELAKALGKATGPAFSVSPDQIDHLVRGYLSWIGATALQVSDFVARPILDRPERPDRLLRDMFLVGNFAEELPSARSRYVTQFYDQAKIINEAYASYMHKVAIGEKDAAQEMKIDDRNKLAAESRVAAVQRELADINAQSRRIEADPNMESDTKRTKLNLLDVKRNKIAERGAKITASGVL